MCFSFSLLCFYVPSHGMVPFFPRVTPCCYQDFTHKMKKARKKARKKGEEHITLFAERSMFPHDE